MLYSPTDLAVASLNLSLLPEHLSWVQSSRVLHCTDMQGCLLLTSFSAVDSKQPPNLSSTPFSHGPGLALSPQRLIKRPIHCCQHDESPRIHYTVNLKWLSPGTSHCLLLHRAGNYPYRRVCLLWPVVVSKQSLTQDCR